MRSDTITAILNQPEYEGVKHFLDSVTSGIFYVEELKPHRPEYGIRVGYAVRYNLELTTSRGIEPRLFIFFPDQKLDDYNIGRTFAGFKIEDTANKFKVVGDTAVQLTATMLEFLRIYHDKYGLPPRSII